MRKFLAALVFAALIGAPAAAQDEPVFDPGPYGGGAVYLNDAHREANDKWGYAGAYRAGDYVYLSGVVAGAWGGEPMDDAAFRENLRQVFKRADDVLGAADASLEDVVEIISFHVWGSPMFSGDKRAHMEALAEVKREFMPAPHPAWSAIGVSELLPNNGVVELRMVAYAPLAD
ncbi:Rid family hydrolase [Hyphococcus sp.]|uniref:Rid family hydrolase n=1 Tax=Hyphococcus sp. TaxID=2038636 RepID=UPI003CCC321A